jgi:Pyridoxamine 5'-phosphate oxidase
MALSDDDRQYLEDHHSAAMITVDADGVAKAARVGIALVGGRLWSSGTETRVRTRRLRRDPRCTLFVFDPGFSWLALETTVQLLEGPEAPEQNIRLFREMQGRPTGPLAWFGAELDETAFRQTMVDERRLIYEFDVHRSYGLR